jgi:DNA-binding transcriptional regulator LsrR (DeoR family)
MFSRRKKKRRIHIPRQELEQLYCDEGLTIVQIAQRYGCGKGTVRQRLKEYGLQGRRKRGKPSRADLERMYYDEGLTLAQIARRCGCGQSTVSRLMRQYGFKTRSNRDYIRLEIPREELERLYYDEGLTQAEIARRYGCNMDTVGKRMQEYGMKTRIQADYRRVDVPREELERLYYGEGLTQAQIARRFGCSEALIAQRMRAFDMDTRIQADYTRVEISPQELRYLYLDMELSIAEIAGLKGCNVTPIFRQLHAYGIPTRPRSVPVAHVPPKVYARWTPDLAYAVGLLTADGNLAQETNTVAFYSTDWEQIVNFRACLQLGELTKALERDREGYKRLYTVPFCDRAFRAFVDKVGLMPNKSKRLGPLAVPRQVFVDYCRGCWDGDGSWPDEQQQNKDLRTFLSSASRPFLEWVREGIEAQTGLRGGISGAQLYYSGPKAVALGRWMYYAPDLPALSRKRAVWERFA